MRNRGYETGNMRCDSGVVGGNDFPGRDVASENWQQHTGFLFTAAVIAAAAGLLFPLSGPILDVLLIFSISLTAAVLIITFSARTTLDVSGFPLLIVLATTLRITLSIALTKLILMQGNAGTIINLFNAVFVKSNGVLAILIFGTVVLISIGITCKAVRDIGRTASDFIADIVPIKQISIDSDLNAGVINKSQFFNLRREIDRERNFFIGMAGVSRFILCSAVIGFLTVIVNIVVGMAAGVAGGSVTGVSVKTYTILAASAGVIIQISTLVTALACIYLVRKSSVSSAPDDELAEQKSVKRIEVIARVAKCETSHSEAPAETLLSEATKLQSGDTANYIESTAIANIETEKKLIVEDLEWLDEQIFCERENNDCGLWSSDDIKDDYCYESIAELIEGKSSDEDKTILIAAENIEELPVTIPVNIAMRLAQRKKRCLLIGLDTERDAISKVFDIDGSDFGGRVRAKAIATCIDNLWVWPASYFDRSDGTSDAINIKELIVELGSRYDYLVVYAPNIESAVEKDKIVGSIKLAMLFGSESESKSSRINEFYRLLISSGCAILEPGEVFAVAT